MDENFNAWLWENEQRLQRLRRESLLEARQKFLAEHRPGTADDCRFLFRWSDYDQEFSCWPEEFPLLSARSWTREGAEREARELVTALLRDPTWVDRTIF